MQELDDRTINKITEVVAVNMLSMIWITQYPGETLSPPTIDQAISEFENSPLFHRAVKGTVMAIMGIVSQPAVQADAGKMCDDCNIWKEQGANYCGKCGDYLRTA